MSDLDKIVKAIEAEAEFWLSVPGSSNPDDSRYMLAPLLSRLALRIREQEDSR